MSPSDTHTHTHTPVLCEACIYPSKPPTSSSTAPAVRQQTRKCFERSLGWKKKKNSTSEGDRSAHPTTARGGRYYPLLTLPIRSLKLHRARPTFLPRHSAAAILCHFSTGAELFWWRLVVGAEAKMARVKPRPPTSLPRCHRCRTLAHARRL